MVLAEWGGRVREEAVAKAGERGKRGKSRDERRAWGRGGECWSLVSANTDGVEPYNGLIRTQSIRRPKRADNLVSLGRFGSRCSKAQRWILLKGGFHCSKVG